MMGGTLRRGENGEDVEQLQRWLNQAGYVVLVDGDYGSRTQAAVAMFLADQGREGDGSTLDEQGMTLLSQVAAKPNPTRKVVPPAVFEPTEVEAGDEQLGADVLGVNVEARAFARVLCSRRTGTPLSVGLFGDAGAGKSFFMSRLQHKVQARCDAYSRLEAKLKDQGDEAALARLEDRWHSRVAQVDFNAWHFAEPNLWASLVTRLFDQLSEIINPSEKIDDTRARLLNEISDGTRRREEADLELVDAEKLLAEASAERDKRERALEELREELSVVEAAAPVTGDLEGVEGAEPRPILKVTSPIAALRISLRWIWSQGKWTRIGIIVGLILIVIGIVLAILAWRGIIDLEPAFTLGTTCVGFVTGIVSTCVAWWGIVSPNIEKAKLGYATANQGYAAVTDFLDGAARDLLAPGISALDDARRRYEEASAGTESAKTAAELASEDVSRARKALKELQGGQRFYSFIRDKGDSDDYRQHLGLVSTVRQDFAKLEEILRQVEKEGPGEDSPAPVSRIVIYIDDLDRCEPERVVEVLQAVHLLLATPIFVVVLAVDVRWLRRSLSLHYEKLLGPPRGPNRPPDEARPTPQHYLEKVFQIPFSLRPMGPRGFASLVEHVLEPGIEKKYGSKAASNEGKTSGDDADEKDADAPRQRRPEPSAATKAAVESDLESDLVLELHEDEVEFAKNLHAVIDTPRLAKALVNTYRLLRAEIPTDEIDEYLADQSYLRVMTLLAIQVGRSGEAAVVFEALTHTKQPTLGAAIIELAKSTTSDRRERRWRTLHSAIRQAGTDALPVDELLPWLTRVRRFSFNPWPSKSF